MHDNEPGLKPGQKAYMVSDTGDGTISTVTITGPCDEGPGYNAISDCDWDEIHTCNFFTTASKRKAKLFAIKVCKNQIEIDKNAQRYAQRSMDWLNYQIWKLS
jgi:hypothetical protein